MRRPDVDLETQLAEADTRRREMEQQRIQKLSLLSGADKIEKVSPHSSVLRGRREELFQSILLTSLLEL